MKKIKWISLIGFLAGLVVIFGFVNSDYYDEFVKHPLDSGSGTTSSMLFYFLMFKIDQYTGKIGVFMFLIFLTLSCLFYFIKTNIFTFSDMYRNWKEKKDK